MFPGRWQVWHERCKMGATSLANVTVSPALNEMFDSSRQALQVDGDALILGIGATASRLIVPTVDHRAALAL